MVITSSHSLSRSSQKRRKSTSLSHKSLIREGLDGLGPAHCHPEADPASSRHYISPEHAIPSSVKPSQAPPFVDQPMPHQEPPTGEAAEHHSTSLRSFFITKASEIEESSLESMAKDVRTHHRREAEHELICYRPGCDDHECCVLLSKGVRIGERSTIPPRCLTSGILFPPTFHPDVSHPEFFSAAIPSGYFASGAYRRMGEEGVSTSPVRRIRIL
ncbi:hypothetical protein CK203_110233 [Vitis vinifera]|uniref:Uncharacterized protein n=1 Tax=Vitis vinifera TaxID=29760 RepID=A0A438CVW7_VITVI|nr:hypothetical protein CK203_110233 [Vitis vinifera]